MMRWIAGVLMLSGWAWAADAPASLEQGEGTQKNATQATLPEWIHPRFEPYEASGRPDPFMSFIQIRAVEQARQIAQRQDRQREPASPLETVDVRTLKLVGILTPRKGGGIGVVQMPDGKSFIVRPGMGIGLYGGVIKEIRNGVLIIEEKTYDILGEERTQTVTLSLRPNE